jgi:hypothetical protein
VYEEKSPILLFFVLICPNSLAGIRNRCLESIASFNPNHHTVTKIIVEKGWFSDTEKKVDVGYEKLFKEMDDWASIPLIRRLTDLWLEREDATDTLKNCAQRLVDAGNVK